MAPGIVPAAGAELAPAAPEVAAGRSRMLEPAPAREEAWLDSNASSSVLTKNTVAQAAVERDRKFALPVAPNKLPEEPLPNEAPMSAPLPCCTSTSPIMVSAERICTARRRFIQICMMETSCESGIRVESGGRPQCLAALQMETKSAALSAAPPINPPSISGIEKSTEALSGFTLPP